MKELSLFSGAGGGLLATHHLLGWQTIGYVENDDYCQRVIAQRIKDGLLDRAPIFGDIRTFISEGYAEGYQGMVDVITGGDPCQRASKASSGRSNAEQLASEFIKAIRIIRPTYVIRENPANIRKDTIWDSHRFAKELEDMDYTTAITEIRACCMGADHQRARLFVLGKIPDTNRIRLQRGNNQREGIKGGKKGEQQLSGLLDASLRDRISDPRTFRSSDVVAHRVDRLKAIGNGQVPIMAATAWEILKP